MDAGVATAASVCLCVLARCAGFVVAATWPVFPGVCLRVRSGLAVALAAVAMPAALATRSDGRAAADLAVVAPAIEFLTGLAMGTGVACVTAAVAWAVGMMAAVAGLSFSDPADPEGGEGPGFARLAWWIAAGGFLAAGGNRAVVGGLLESFASLPIGEISELGGAGNVAAVFTALPATAFALAVSLALPALATLLAFHATAAIVIRATAFEPGEGLLQAAAGLVLLGIFFASVGSWTVGFPAVVEPAVARCFAPSGVTP